MSRPSPRVTSHQRSSVALAERIAGERSIDAGWQRSAGVFATALALPVFIGFGYAGAGSLPLLLSGVVLLAVLLSQPAASRLRPLDWGMLLVLVYEIPSLRLSPFPANGLRSAATISVAALLYFLVRLVARTSSRALVVAAVVGAGGLLLAWFAVSQFNGHFQELRANGLSDAIAFRYRLIVPPSRWVLGEWFTLLLMTLPSAFAVSVPLWLTGRWKLAAVALLPTSVIAAALTLSCSRAVFWGVALFFVALFAVGILYRVVSFRAGAIGMVSALCGLTVLVLVENVLYPGVLEAYASRHTSQARSTEGRLAIWKRSVDVFKLSPLWGVGSGNAPLFLAASAEEDQTTGFASRTFSLPVQVLTEKGIVGAALYLAVLVLAGREAHRKLRNPIVSPQTKGLTCCMVAGIIAVLFRELTYSSLLEHAATAMLFTMSLAFLAAEESV
jgi:O-antigen ligase